jgi:DNA invertase Pin-like site-specific DNA recombinase
MRYFYARVSTKEQNLARQLEAAKSYSSAFDKVFSDKQSGKNFDRPEYQKMKSILVAGDEIVVKSLDRLSRNKTALKKN